MGTIAWELMLMKVERPRPRRLVIIGGYPPPIGGVSIHIKRLVDKAFEEGYCCEVIDFSNIDKNQPYVINKRDHSRILKALLGRNKIVHIHTSGTNKMKAIMFLTISVIGKVTRNPTVVTFHSAFNNPRLVKSTAPFMKFISRIIAVGPHVRETLVSSGIDPRRISVIPAFIPPRTDPGNQLDIPESVEIFMSTHSPIICANAYDVPLNKNDLYGVGMCVELCDSLRGEYPRVGILVVNQNAYMHDWMLRLKDKIEERKLQENLIILNEPVDFFSVIQRSDVFIRPTSTDGDSISLREALYVGTPVVASDVVSRPEGTILFKTSNMEDLTRSVKAAINCRNRKSPPSRTDSFGDRIIDLYESLYERCESN
jgi:glycosyltransferase involved in cell wall biosynthesis